MEAARILETAETYDYEAADEPCTAEKAECTCPDFCERDHTNE